MEKRLGVWLDAFIILIMYFVAEAKLSASAIRDL